MDELIDVSSITFEDLQEEYLKLRERCSQLIIVNDQDTQRIHELRRSLETAIAAEAYLAQELDQVSSAQTSQDDALLHKKQNEVDELKKRQSALLTENEDLHQDVVDLQAENERLNQKIKELTIASQPAEITYQIPKDYLDLRERLEAENLELLAKLDETQESVIKFTLALAEKEKHIEILKDQVFCLEENLQSKREEVDEKSHLLESAQEQVVEMNANIAMLTSCPENDDRKGNSLFAEVDDQRQAMKQLLAVQKKSYMQMKKVFNESQHEIRRLKRENVAMHNELHACSAIFCSADKTYKEKLNERILQLLKQNEDLEKKLMVTQQEMISMANDKGVVWLDSMLLFCKQETEELKKQLHSSRIQKGILEERLRNSQQDMAKWRFEALKTRCVLIDREGLLTDNKIEFKNFTNKDMRFTYNELEDAKPNLNFDNQSALQIQRDSKLKIESHEVDEPVQTEVPIIEIEDDEVELRDDQDKQNLDIILERTLKVDTETHQFVETRAIKLENCDVQTETNKEQIDATNREPLESSPFIKTEDINIEISSSPEFLDKPRIKTEPNNEQNKENVCASQLESETLPKVCAKTCLKETIMNNSNEIVEDLKPRPSILVTKRNILVDESNTKSVQFAQTESSTKSNQPLEPKYVCKSTRTKSNVIVRRILVGSRTKSEPGAAEIP